MPRVTHVQKARKDNPAVKAGESYYWWKFRFGGKRFSKTRPRPSQLTQSAYYGTVRDLCEQIEDAQIADNDDFISLRDEIRDGIEELRDETQGSLDNMPESLQYSPTGELLQERIDALEGADCEFDCIEEFDFDEEDYNPDEHGEEDEHEANEEERRQFEFNGWLSGAKDELTEAVSNCEV